MIIFLFGFSGSGKNYLSALLNETNEYNVIHTSEIVAKYGISTIMHNPSIVIDEISEQILNTEKTTIVEGIRQPDIYSQIREQAKEQVRCIFLDNPKMIENLIKRGLNYDEIYKKIKLDINLGLLDLRHVSADFRVRQTKESNEFFVRTIKDMIKENG